MTPEQLLNEHDACRRIVSETPPQQPHTIRRGDKKWHVCHFSLDSFTVLFTVYVGPRGARSARVTVIDDSRDVPAVDRVSVWSSEHWPLETLLSISSVLSSEASDEQILAHLRKRTEALLAAPADTVVSIRTFISDSRARPPADSIRVLQGGATGLKR